MGLRFRVRVGVRHNGLKVPQVCVGNHEDMFPCLSETKIRVRV